MKSLNALALVFFATLSIQSTLAHAGDYPECQENSVGEFTTMPCVLAGKDAQASLFDMVLNNPEGYKSLFQKKIKRGLMVSPFEEKTVRVTAVSNRRETGRMTVSTMKYEVLLSDCRGTDACGPSYVWQAIEETKSDGYMYESKFTNTLQLANQLPEQVVVKK